MKAVPIIVLFVATLSQVSHSLGRYKGLEFLEPCPRRDPGLEECLAKSVNLLAERFRHGLPELGYNDVEPIILDELHIALDGGGPNSYRAEFKDIAARGVSSVRVIGLRAEVTDDEVRLQLTLHIPKIRADAEYRSSGRLLIVQASGAGDYWGEYYGVKAKVFIRAKPYQAQGQKFLKLQQLKMDFIVRDIKMAVKNLHDGNTILQTALNLFINNNSQDLLKEMKPDLQRKLVQVMSTFVEKIFNQIPYDAFITD